MKIIQNYITKFKRYGEKRDGTFDSIEIHSIGTAQSNDEKVRESMNQYSPGGIVHAIVAADREERVLEILPWDNICWADAGYGNHHSYTVEICESNNMRYTSNSASYVILDNVKFLADIQRGYNNAVKYVAIKCKEFGFNPEKKLSNGLYQVYSHQEANEKGLASAHEDPFHIWTKIGKNMDTFRAEVKNMMGEEIMNIKSTRIDDSNVEAISQVVYGEAGVIRSYDALLGVAQCIYDMWQSGQFGKTVNEVMKKNFSAYGNRTTTDDARQAVYDVFCQGKKRFGDAKVLQFRSLTKYSDGNGNLDKQKCAALLGKYEYLGKDVRDNRWGHLYFGKKIGTDVTVEKKQTYRVRLKWGTDMTTQLNAFEKLQNAMDCAKEAIPGYKVFDESGNIVYDTGELTVENQCRIASKWASDTANNNVYGYNNGKDARGGNPDFACSSFVNEAFRQAGIELPKSATVYTAKMKSIYTKAGFEIVTDKVNLKTGKGLELGDIVLAPGKHVEIYVGNSMLSGARGNANSGKPENGKAGDQSGYEIAVSPYWNYPWTVVLRYVGVKKENSVTVSAKQYIVQAGLFKDKEKAQEYAKKIREEGFDAIVKEYC